MRLSAGDGWFRYATPAPGVLHVVVAGHDRGQFGTATLDEIRHEILRHQPLELFVDASQALSISPSVSEAWTRFFSQDRAKLSRVSVLVGSKAISLTVAIAQHLSRTGNLIQIYTDRELFEARLRAAEQRRTRPG